MAAKPRRSKGRRGLSSHEESSDEMATIKPKETRANKEQEPTLPCNDMRRIKGTRCIPGKSLYGLNGYVPSVRSEGLRMELKADAPTSR